MTIHFAGGKQFSRGSCPLVMGLVTSTFFSAVYLLPKDLRFEHGGAKLASCARRHLTLLYALPASDSWTWTSWQVSQRDSDTAESGKPRIVLFCVKRSMSKSAAVPPQVRKIHCEFETVINVPEWIALITRLLCRPLFTQCKNTWLVRIRLCRLVRYVFIDLVLTS